MTWEYVGQLVYVLSMALALLAGLAGLLWLYRKFGGQVASGGTADDSIEVLSTRYLSTKSKVHVVKYGDECFMIVDNGNSCAITGLKS